MAQTKKKAPLEAATSKSAKTEHIQTKYTTKEPRGQALFEAASALDDLGTQLSAALGLLNLVTESMEPDGRPEGSRLIPADILTTYADSLWVLFRYLEGLQMEAKAQAERFYQEGRRAQ